MLCRRLGRERRGSALLGHTVIRETQIDLRWGNSGKPKGVKLRVRLSYVSVWEGCVIGGRRILSDELEV